MIPSRGSPRIVRRRPLARRRGPGSPSGRCARRADRSIASSAITPTIPVLRCIQLSKGVSVRPAICDAPRRARGSRASSTTLRARRLADGGERAGGSDRPGKRVGPQKVESVRHRIVDHVGGTLPACGVFRHQYPAQRRNASQSITSIMTPTMDQFIRSWRFPRCLKDSQDIR